MFQEDILDLAYWHGRLKIAETEILPENFKTFRKHIKRLQDEEKKHRTIIIHLMILIRFSKWLEKPYEAVTEDDFNDYLDTMEALKTSTLKLHKVVIRVFIGKINPKLAGCIKTKNIQHSSITPDQLLTDEEIDCLIRHAPTARDKALIACLTDSGARKGELLSTTISDAKFDEYGCLLWLREGKTGPRPARLIFASSYLRQWLEIHPRKEDPDAPIFCSFREPYNLISRSGLYQQIAIIGKTAGIKKRINPHSFRHARATDLAKKLKSEQKLKAVLGWKANSQMANIYIHLSANDINAAMLEASGLKLPEEEEEKPRVLKCPRCKEIIDKKAQFCFRCGLPLTTESSKTIENEKTAVSELVLQLQKADPAILNALINAVKDSCNV
jgi:integrase